MDLSPKSPPRSPHLPPQLEPPFIKLAESTQQLVHATATNTTLEIIGTEKNDQKKTFYRIEVVVKSSPADPGQSWIVLRRFSEFYELDLALRKRFPTLSDILPQCPEKSSSKADRPQLLNSYLLILLQQDEPFTSDEVMKFLATETHRLEVAPDPVHEVANFVLRKAERKDVVIKRGKSHTDTYDIVSPPQTIAWSFSTSEFDVGFSVKHEHETDDIFTYSRHRPRSMHVGHVTIRKPGKVSLVWDNTYSKIRKKQLAYRVGIVASLVWKSMVQVVDDEGIVGPTLPLLLSATQKFRNGQIGEIEYNRVRDGVRAQSSPSIKKHEPRNPSFILDAVASPEGKPKQENSPSSKPLASPSVPSPVNVAAAASDAATHHDGQLNDDAHSPGETSAVAAAELPSGSANSASNLSNASLSPRKPSLPQLRLRLQTLPPSVEVAVLTGFRLSDQTETWHNWMKVCQNLRNFLLAKETCLRCELWTRSNERVTSAGEQSNKDGKNQPSKPNVQKERNSLPSVVFLYERWVSMSAKHAAMEEAVALRTRLLEGALQVCTTDCVGGERGSLNNVLHVLDVCVRACLCGWFVLSSGVMGVYVLDVCARACLCGWFVLSNGVMSVYVWVSGWVRLICHLRPVECQVEAHSQCALIQVNMFAHDNPSINFPFSDHLLGLWHCV